MAKVGKLRRSIGDLLRWLMETDDNMPKWYRDFERRIAVRVAQIPIVDYSKFQGGGDG